jgi:hypothetical protein
LVVLQTFSKSWGLAGIRCGVAISSAPLIDYLNKMKAPYVHSANKCGTDGNGAERHACCGVVSAAVLLAPLLCFDAERTVVIVVATTVTTWWLGDSDNHTCRGGWCVGRFSIFSACTATTSTR